MSEVWLVASQKGGVCKTTLTTALALTLGKTKKVLLCDVDAPQHSSCGWQELRDEAKPLPFEIARCATTQAVGKAASKKDYDLVIIDGAPHASLQTSMLAEASDRVLLPTITAALALGPNLLLANELVEKGVEREKLLFCICMSPSPAEFKSAAETIIAAGFAVAEHDLRYSVAYAKASDRGLAVTEAPYASLRKAAKAFIKSVVDNKTYKVTN